MASDVAMPAKTKSKKYDEWEVNDAMHTMMRAGEIVKDKKLMGQVKKHAAEHAKKMADVASRANQLAKAGRISEKAMAKMKSKSADGGSKDIDKLKPIA